MRKIAWSARSDGANDNPHGASFLSGWRNCHSWGLREARPFGDVLARSGSTRAFIRGFFVVRFRQVSP
jgi:hypothetical protein